MCSGWSVSRCSLVCADEPITPTQERHFFLVGWILSERVSSDLLLRFSARFSLMDLPDFLDMLCRGDLSLMGNLSERKPEWLRAPRVRPWARQRSGAMGAGGQRTPRLCGGEAPKSN